MVNLEPTADTNPTPTANPNPSSMWSNIVKKDPAASKSPATHHVQAATALGMVGKCNSTKGITMAVVDANAVIDGGQNLSTFADKFVTVSEVLSEIRDPVSRHRLAFIPFTIDVMEPSPESLNKVIKFARETGDLQTLSDVDLKLIALTYMLEAQIHGTKHLRDTPPPIHTVKVKRLPEKDLPGWGSNVSNLEEWEALENESEDKVNSNSKILPLKDLNLNTISSDNCSDSGSFATNGDSHPEPQEEDEQSMRKYRRYPPKSKEINIDGKKMVAEGVDASQGQHEDDDGDWKPAVSRSTHRRYLRRKARREHFETLAEQEFQQDQDNAHDGNLIEETINLQQQSSQISKDENGKGETDNGNDDEVSSILKQMRLEEDSLKSLQEEEGNEANENGHDFEDEEGGSEAANQGLNNIENSSEAGDTVEVSSTADDDVSEQSWTLRALSESSVACITGDYAMQNVILQMGLRLLAPGGMQIRQLHRWILKCHACYTVTSEIGRIFCPKCGNGGTLRKVAVTIGENGIILAARKPRVSLRGTKFSLPLPQGGRGAIAKNPILREDQLPQKFLYPKTKKKGNRTGDDFFSTSDDAFMHHNGKKAPLQPPVRKALAVFSQRRNPNDNHYSRSRH